MVRHQVVQLKTPAALRSCKDQPVARVTDDRDFALFVQDTIEAGADCRDKMSRRNALEDNSQ